MKLINKFPDFILNLLLKITTFEFISFNLICHKLKFSLKFAKIFFFIIITLNNKRNKLNINININ